jgi:hypothetical protein
MEAFEQFEVDGVTVEFHYDEWGGEHCNPRDMDNVTTMVCWHPDYVLGDEQFTDYDGRGAVETPFDTGNSSVGIVSMEHLRRYLGICRQAIHIRPLYLLDHSGLSIRAGSPSAADPGGWDTSMVGFVYTTHERITEQCGEDARYHTAKWIAEQVEQDVRLYDSYLQGEVYGFVVAPGSADEDSCWGFLGDPDESGMRSEATSGARCIAAERKRLRELPWLPTFGKQVPGTVTS